MATEGAQSAEYVRICHDLANALWWYVKYSPVEEPGNPALPALGATVLAEYRKALRCPDCDGPLDAEGYHMPEFADCPRCPTCDPTLIDGEADG